MSAASDPFAAELEAQFAGLTALCTPCLFGGEGANDLIVPLRKNCRYLRASLPIEQVLHLLDFEIFLVGEDAPFGGYALSASSLYAPAHPGPVTDMSAGLHTDRDAFPFILFDLGEERGVSHIRVVNRKDRESGRSWKLQIHRSDDSETWDLVHDHRSYVNNVETLVWNRVETVSDPRIKGILSAYTVSFFNWLRHWPLTRAMIEDNCRSYGLDAPDARIVEDKLNTEIMHRFAHEITGHGIHKSFRFWPESDIQTYLTRSMQVCADLQQLSPYACVGYGGVLAYVRDGALIPHDDDIDVIFAFERSAETPTIAAALARTESYLRDKGWTVAGDMRSHRWVNVWTSKNMDVFVGLIEGDHVSFFPGPRKKLEVAQIFPPMTGKLYGVDLLLPRNPFHYIETVYGENWRTPEPGFAHDWTGKDHADILE